MNVLGQITDGIELLENRKKIAVKSGRGPESIAYGKTLAYTEALAVLKDIKKYIEKHEKMQEEEKDEKNDTSIDVLKIQHEEELQVV